MLGKLIETQPEKKSLFNQEQEVSVPKSQDVRPNKADYVFLGLACLIILACLIKW